ncbi:MAG: SRPBCC family protein [Bacteroidetes bacterium]|nr:SRPBCC family protein [Bacteroidota bacterium]
MSRRHAFTDSQQLPISREKLMAFFSVPENLGRLTPEGMRFKVLHTTSRPIQQDTVLTYRLRKFGMDMKWKSWIQDWKPNEYFVDMQQEGPFRYWKHRHTLREIPGGTEVIDELEYEVPYGRLGEWGHSWFLRKDILRSFAYRKQQLEAIFGIYVAPVSS